MPEEARTPMAQEWAPPPAAVEAEIAAYRGGWLGQMPHRVSNALGLETVIFLLLFFWRSGGLMLVGMGLFKLGVLSARSSPAFYRRLAAAGFGLGLPIVVLGVVYNTRHEFAWEHSQFQGTMFNYRRLARRLPRLRRPGHAGGPERLAARLPASASGRRGRMAFTNYISQSVHLHADLLRPRPRHVRAGRPPRPARHRGRDLGPATSPGRPGGSPASAFGPLEWLWAVAHLHEVPRHGGSGRPPDVPPERSLS